MVVDPSGDIATTLELQGRVAKKGSGRVIPLHPDLREALIRLREQADDTNGPVIVSERGGPMRPVAICQSLPGYWPDWLFVALWPPNVHHQSCPACAPSRWFVA